jgi:phage tail-like protein
MSSLLSDPVVSLHFDVIIDGCPIGSFTECTGLGAEYAVQSYEEGGQNGSPVHLLGKLKFTNITLKRALDANTVSISVWFDTIRLNPLRTTAQIVAMTTDGLPLRVWHIFDVVPVRWTGPQFSSTGNSIATETLELAHHGFY